MSIFANVGNFFKSMFSGLVRVFKKFIEVALPIAKQVIIAQLKDIAMQAVTEMSFENLTNEEKRKEAMIRISSYAKDKGIDASESIVGLVTELAVQMLKG